MQPLGDFQAGATVDFKFPTVVATGAPTTLAGSPVVSVFKANNGTPSTAGVTLTVDFGTTPITGLNHVRILTTDAFYEADNDYQVVITAGTVDGVSVVGYVVASFSIENRPPAGVVRLKAEAGTLSVTQMTTDLGEATAEHYKGRSLVGLSGALKGQATRVEDYEATGGLLTFVAMTEAASDGDRFLIV
jgi:hypothetical protein